MLRTDKEQCGSVLTGADRSPTEDLLLLGQRGGNISAEVIVRFDPQYVLILGRTGVTVVDKVRSVLRIQRAANGIAVSPVSYVHVFSIVRNVEFAGVIEDLTVDISVGILRLDRVGDGRPIVRAIGIFRGLDVLCGIKTEAVYAVISQRIEQVGDNILLKSGVSGVDIRELTVKIVLCLAVTGTVTGRSRVIQQVGVTGKASDSGAHLADFLSGGAVLQMVGDNVCNNLDTVLVQLSGSSLKIFSGTESVTDGEVGGLIEGPPVSRVGTVINGCLRLLDRRYLYGSVTGCGDFGSVLHEIAHAPVKRVQDITALDVGRKSIVLSGCSRGILVGSRESAGDDRDSQQHDKNHDQANYFFHLHFKTS